MDELNQNKALEEQPIGQPTEQSPAEKPAEQPVEQPAEPAVELPVEQTSARQPEELPAEPKGEEQPATEENAEKPAEQPAQPPQNASFWQGGYTYQNPNPYWNGTPYTPPVKKKESKAPIIIACVAAGLMLVCCLLIVASLLFGWNPVAVTGTEESKASAGDVVADVDKEEEKQNAQRPEGQVYNMPEITTEEKKGEELSFVEINKKVKNSVVGILIGEVNREVQFSGSGFIISEDGYIMTNAHVISGASQVKVVLSDGITEYNAVIVGEDERSDLAILKVEADGLQAAELGNSDRLEVGETVVAIGNPYGMELAGSMTDGIVSAMNRKIEMNGSFMTLIQTNAAINPGNSGGPLVNVYGQIVGITSSKLVATDYEGIGFAIPINYATSVTEELVSYGYIKTRAYIGIQGSDLTAGYAQYHNLPRGVYVSYVDPQCDAAKKGLKEDDIIIGFNGKEILSMAELNDLKDSFHPGDTVTIKVWRDGEEFELSVTLTEASK